MIRRCIIHSSTFLHTGGKPRLLWRSHVATNRNTSFVPRNCTRKLSSVSSAAQKAQNSSERQQELTLKQRIDDLVQKKPVGTHFDMAESKFVASFICKSCKPRDALTAEIVETAQTFHDRLLREGMFPVPNSVWAALIRGYAHVGLFQQSKAILDKMEVCNRNNPDFYPSPNDYHYSTVVYACALNGSDEALQMAEILIQDAEQRKFITIEMYNSLLLLHSRRAKSVYGAAASAEDWLLKITGLSAKSDHSIAPNTITFNLVLRAWKETPEEQGAARAHEILKLLCQVSHADEKSFGTVISAYTARGLMEKAEEMLQDAVVYFRDRQQIGSLEQCLNEVCFGWARQGLVDRVQATMKRYKCFIQPNHATHGACIEAYLRNNDLAGAEGYFEHMINDLKVKPTRREFATILRALNKKNEPQRAVMFLKQMVEYTEMRGFRCFPEPHDLSQCLDSLRRSKTMTPEDISEAIKEVADLGISRRIVNAEGLAMAINFLCKADQPLEAASLLCQMETLAETTAFEWPHYAVGLYTDVITAFSRQKDALSAENAYEVFKRMNRQGIRAVQPTIKTYTSLIVAFRNVPSRRSGEIVKELYKEIKSHDRDPNSKVQFDQKCFKHILWTLEGAKTAKYSSWALTILTYMVNLHVLKEREGVEPDSSCFNATIQAMVNVGFLEDAVGIIEIISDHHAESQLRHLPSRPVLESTLTECRREGKREYVTKIQAVIDKHFPNERELQQQRNIKVML